MHILSLCPSLRCVILYPHPSCNSSQPRERGEQAVTHVRQSTSHNFNKVHNMDFAASSWGDHSNSTQLTQLGQGAQYGCSNPMLRHHIIQALSIPLPFCLYCGYFQNCIYPSPSKLATLFSSQGAPPRSCRISFALRATY